MKTITKTVAFFAAAIAFTACTNQTIEPVSATKQPQFIIAHSDTLINVGYDGNEYVEYSEATLLDEPNATPKPRKPAGKPATPSVTQPTPQPAVMPVEVPSPNSY